MAKGRKLQVLLNNEWKFVFCRNQIKRYPIITDDPKNALTEKYGNGETLKKYFEDSFGSLEFRLIKEA